MEFYKNAYYLYVDQFNGSAKIARHLGASKLRKFYFEQYYQRLSAPIGTGLGVGKPKLITPTNFSFELNDKDILMPRLLNLYSEARYISEFIVTKEKLFPSGELASFVSYRFKDCFMISMRKSQIGNGNVFEVKFEKFEKKDNHIEAWSN